MWKDLLKQYEGINNDLKINLPADKSEIERAERVLGVSFPTELKGLLLELNGDSWLLFSVAQIVENNLLTREALGEYYDKLNELLFIAGNGCGDYYAYEVCGEKTISTKIILWEHEDNSRRSVATSLSDLINRYYDDQI